ncbi:MAG: hypothetical protein JNK65_10130, partial [Deltaproteobacteria bacterium]|nr:hypothetical protein [Deltaproteobacteria bacterium]
GLNIPVKVTYDGQDVAFIPISVNVKELRIKIAIRFEKKDGVQQLKIEKQSGDIKAVDIIGGDGLGRFVHVNSNRNPIAAGLEAFDAQTGAIATSFRKGVLSGILCGTEAGLNHKTTGLGRWESDLLKLTGYNNANPFRLPLEFDLLNRFVGIDIAYDVLRGDISFNDRGIQIKHVPVRISPSPRTLGGIPDAIKNSLVGSLSMPMDASEVPPANPLTNDVRNFGLELSEDAVNQGLFAANMAGMLDLDIDPNFFTNNGLDFFDQATPTVRDFLAKKVDLNQNGVDDDDLLPLQMRMRTDKTIAPVMHFLNPQEINELDQRYRDSRTAQSGSGSGSTPVTGINKSLKYFRFTLSNVDLAIYRVYPLGAEAGGYKTYCVLDKNIFEPAEDSAARTQYSSFEEGQTIKGCPQSLSVFIEKPAGGCPKAPEGMSFKESLLPVKNGPVISADPQQGEVPLIRFKLNVILYGVMQGVAREVAASDKYEVDLTSSPIKLKTKAGTPSPINFLRVKFLTGSAGVTGLTAKLKVVENRTAFSNMPSDPSAELGNRIERVILNGALGESCSGLNEIRVPLPDRFPNTTAQSEGGLVENLKSFGVKYLDLGDTPAEMPQVAFDDQGLYVDLLAHLGVCYEDGTGSCSQPRTLNIGTITPLTTINPNILKAFDWSKH